MQGLQADRLQSDRRFTGASGISLTGADQTGTTRLRKSESLCLERLDWRLQVLKRLETGQNVPVKVLGNRCNENMQRMMPKSRQAVVCDPLERKEREWLGT